MTPDAETKLACLVCRHRKVACDRQRPKCGLCEKNKFDCQYRAREHKPGLRAGYVSQLEKRVEHLEQRMEEIVGQLSRQQSRNIDSLPDFNELTSGVSFDLQNTQSLEYGTAEHMSSAPPDDSQVYRNTSCSAPPSIQTNESLHYELQALWLQNYHPWFPILHHTSVKAAFSVGPKVQRLVQKAIMAVTIRDTRALSAEQKVSQSRKMDEEVTIEALSSSSLDSVQALLILSILAWGEGNWSQCSNLIAVCKRKSQQLSLATVAGVARFKSLRLSVRDSDVPMTNLTIDREERIRAFWMMKMLDSIFAMVSASNYSAPSVPLAANFPCSDTAWALEDPFREGVSFHDLRYSSGFSMCISLCTNELGAVHRFQETVREACDIAGGLEWQSSAQSLDESLTIRREEFVAAVFRLINAEFSQNHRAEMEPFIVLTNCFLNMAVISLLQSKSSLPPGILTDSEPWSYANHRSLYACENMAAKVRRMNEDELRNCSPCLVLAIFVAARFYIVHTNCLNADISVNLHCLSYSLHICSCRWPLAKLFEIVIRTAVAEHRTPLTESVLPVEFYDLRYSAIEVSPTLQNWVDNGVSPILSTS